MTMSQALDLLLEYGTTDNHVCDWETLCEPNFYESGNFYGPDNFYIERCKLCGNVVAFVDCDKQFPREYVVLSAEEYSSYQGPNLLQQAERLIRGLSKKQSEKKQK